MKKRITINLTKFCRTSEHLTTYGTKSENSEVMELTELPVTCVFWRDKLNNRTMAKHFPTKQELQFLT